MAKLGQLHLLLSSVTLSLLLSCSGDVNIIKKKSPNKLRFKNNWLLLAICELGSCGNLKIIQMNPSPL